MVSIIFAAALWTGFGGRKVAVLSFALGVAVGGLALTDPWGSGEGTTSGRVGILLVGLAIVLASAFALSDYRHEARPMD
jgi:hypothetical protein